MSKKEINHYDIEKFLKENGYYLEGVWYPRVTAICKIKNKPGLYKFYADQESYEVAQSKLSKASNEGKYVHEILEAIISGREVIIPQEYIGIKKSFDEFLKNHYFYSKREWLEKRVLHREHRYIGTFDIVGELDGKFSIIDIKTSKAVYNDYALQTAAYMYALKNETWLVDKKGNKILIPKDIEKRYILRISQVRICNKCGAKKLLRGMGDEITGGDPNCEHEFGEILGEWELKEFENHEEDFEAFLSCKKLWEWEYKDYLEEIGYL
jgi:hypothetical protein